MHLPEALKQAFTLERVAARGGSIIAIAVVSWAIYALMRRALRGALQAASGRIEDEGRRQRATTLVMLVGSVLKYVIIFLAAMMILREIGINPAPILAGAGLVGLAVGFGAQNLVRDVISGFFIIMEGQYAVGDLVEINGVFGRVEGVGLRSTLLRQPNGKLRHFPNGTVNTADNFTEKVVAHIMTVPVPGGLEDPGAMVTAILDDFEREFRVFEVPPIVGPVERLETYANVIRVGTRSVPGRHEIVEQKLPARLTAALERAGYPVPPGTEVSIVLAFPPPGARG